MSRVINRTKYRPDRISSKKYEDLHQNTIQISKVVILFVPNVCYRNPQTTTESLKPTSDKNKNKELESVIEKRIKKLRQAYQHYSGWQTVIDNLDEKKRYTDYDVHYLKWKCRYLAKALEIAIDKIDFIILRNILKIDGRTNRQIIQHCIAKTYYR